MRPRSRKSNYPMIGDPELNVAKLYGMLPSDAGNTSEGRTAATNATVRTVFMVGPDKNQADAGLMKRGVNFVSRGGRTAACGAMTAREVGPNGRRRLIVPQADKEPGNVRMRPRSGKGIARAPHDMDIRVEIDQLRFGFNRGYD